MAFVVLVLAFLYLFFPLVFGNELLTLPAENKIECGETVTGTSTSYDIIYYEFLIENDSYSITFSTCGSGYDTWLYIKTLDDDENIVDISSCDDCGNCGLREIITISREDEFDENGIYFVGIGGFASSFGDYTLEMSCVILGEPSDEVMELLSLPDNRTRTLGCDSIMYTQVVTGSIESYEIDYYRLIITDEMYSMTLQSCDSNFDTWLYIKSIYQNTVLLDELDCDDCGDCGVQSVLEITQEDQLFDAGSYYYAGIGGFVSSAGDYTLRLSCAYYTTIPFTDNEANLLCDHDLWSVIKGDWSFYDFDGENCMAENVNSDAGNIIWIGSSDGNTPNDEFNNDNSFIFQVYLEIASGSSGNAGIIFRANSVSDINESGESYYFGIEPSTNEIELGVFIDNEWDEKEVYTLFPIEYDTEYILTIECIGGTLYNFYINHLLVWSDYTLSEYVDGSIGLRSYYALPKYTHVVYCQGVDCMSLSSAPTEEPSEQPTEEPTEEEEDLLGVP